MTIRIHEADGTPYEHVLDIRSPFKRYEVPFNTKYKRVRRNTKRYLARQAAAQAAAEGDAEAAEAMGMVDMGFGLEIWEKEKERENWKVADWSEDDEQVMSGATYEWIRMDADFEWISTIEFTQPDFMWVSQLQRDRDVVAQLEVVHSICSVHSLDSLDSSGSQSIVEDAQCHCVEHIYKDCASDELLLQGTLRSCPGTCDCVYHHLVRDFICSSQSSAPINNLIFWVCFISSSSSYVTVMIRMILNKTSSLTRMCQDQMTSRISPSTSCGE
jgi:hypothetical protein